MTYVQIVNADKANNIGYYSWDVPQTSSKTFSEVLLNKRHYLDLPFGRITDYNYYTEPQKDSGYAIDFKAVYVPHTGCALVYWNIKTLCEVPDDL